MQGKGVEKTRQDGSETCCSTFSLFGGNSASGGILPGCSGETTYALARGFAARAKPVKGSWLLGKIVYYQRYIDPSLKKKRGIEKICRFHPSCSEYGKAAVRRYGSMLGALRAAWRIARCNPFSKGGYDPI